MERSCGRRAGSDPEVVQPAFALFAFFAVESFCLRRWIFLPAALGLDRRRRVNWVQPGWIGFGAEASHGAAVR